MSAKLLVEKTKGKYRITTASKEVKWSKYLESFRQLENATYEKMEGKYKCTVTLPSGRKDVRWLNSFTAISQLAGEYGISANQIRWQPMR